MSIGLDNGGGESELFAQYEADYQYAYNELKQRLDDLRIAQASSRPSILQSVDSAVDEAYEIIDQLGVEVQSIPSGQRSKYNTKLRSFRADVDKAKREAHQLSENQDRNALFGDRVGNGGAGGYTDDDLGSSQRQQLLSSQQRLEQSSERLRDSQRVANETESIGAGILNDLRGQREQIVNSRNTLSEADNYVDRSLRTLRSMARRMAANRVITYAIIAVLILLILFVLASKFM